MRALWRKMFVEHPLSVNETYAQHMGQAFRFSGLLLIGGLACLVHGLLPGLFVRTGSGIVARLHDRMVANRDRTLPRTAPPPPINDADAAELN